MSTGGSVSASGGSNGSGGSLASTGGTVGSGGVAASGGGGSGGALMASGGGPSSGGGPGSGGAGNSDGELGNGIFEGEGMSDERYYTAEVSRNEVPYIFITNGWGPGYDEHTHSWLGTSFVVQSMKGTAGSGGQPATYPSMFCGQYSVPEVPACGLPEARANLTSLRTGWRWKSNGNDGGEYNAAYDIWLGSANAFQMYFMVWLRDPASYQPAGQPNQDFQGITVDGVPGTWDIWDGTVNNAPIINYVVPPGTELTELEFDVLDFLADAETRGFSLPTHVRAVAIGFEIWEGDIAGLTSEDFYVDVQ